MAINFNGQEINKIVFDGVEIFGSLKPIDTIVAKIQGGQNHDPSWRVTKAVNGAKLYAMCSAVQAYSCGGTLEGYIDGAWETIATFGDKDRSNDKGGNGGGTILFGYASGLITKNYTNYRVSAKSGSVYPSFCVCHFFGNVGGGMR